MTTVMYGAGVASPNVPWPHEERWPITQPAQWTSTIDLGPLTQALVALQARVDMLAAEVKALKDTRPKPRRKRRAKHV
jgi:hypothetical protein